MKVMKFGGTSVGSPQRMKEVAQIFTPKAGEQSFVVLSAMSGTTNNLVEISDYLYRNNPEGASTVINQLEQKYMAHVEELYSTQEFRDKTIQFLQSEFELLRSFVKKAPTVTDADEKIILAQGEVMSTNMVTNYLQEQGHRVILLSALDIVRTDENGEPDLNFIREATVKRLREFLDYDIYLTQGFICRNFRGEVDNLKRGGSDYTACLIGAVLQVEEIQIWTDIDGMHNNDPRVVEHTEPVRQLYFEEAAELAYFGAKILHPTCIQPAKFAGVPVRLLNTMDPTAPGTLINNEIQHGTIKAVAAKDNITCIQIQSSRMLLAYGFLRKVFEIFEQHKTAIDMICTSEVGVSVTIDNPSRLPEIVGELKKYGTVQVNRDMCIVCVVGDLASGNVGFETRACMAVKKIPVRMISYGGSNYNISFLIKAEDKKRTLLALSETLFKDE
ncbi:MAG: aspartate kinase [Bacteroidaceae bacterium]|nr:aspartate kinase [Bacteroidaceae bacterium]